MEQETQLWMVVGLGNPGPRYEGNRHNVGFMVVDRLAQRGDAMRWQHSERFTAELSKGRLERQQVVLVKPQTYMNLSGRCVGPLSRFYQVSPEQVVAVHDDVDLDPGRLKIKSGGGDGGHKGLRSLTQEMGSQQFIRVRCGVGRPACGDVTDYVLQDFAQAERDAVQDQIARASDAVTAVITGGLRTAMNRYNARPAEAEIDGDTDDTTDKEKPSTSEHAGTTA